MKIYTKKGDAGETGLFGGVRVPKDDLRIQAYGTLDELNAVIGIVLVDQSGVVPDRHRKTLLQLQGHLFQLGAELATPRGKAVGIALIEATEVQLLEEEIDAMESDLKPLKSFVLPGGSKGAATVHLARTVSRRAERELVCLNRAEPLRFVVLQYINRLSDYFFVLARHLNHSAGVADVPWAPLRV